MKIFVGNLSFDAKQSDVLKAFSAFGAVLSVAIVMEKNGKKSRGFGFVEMADDVQAQQAIAVLNGKELLGRPINVMAAVSKKPRVEPVPLRRTGRFKQGRRSISFMKQRSDSGIKGPMPERKYKDNPGRWRKKPKWAPTSQKPQGETKPWEKTESTGKPWQKREGASKPWKKREATSKPWKKQEGASKPWQKRKGKEKSPARNKR